MRRRICVKGTFKLACTWATATVWTGFLLTRIWPEYLIGLFSRGDVRLVEMGTRALLSFFLMLPLVGVPMVAAGYFQAVGKPVQATILTLSRQVLLFIPLLLILPRLWGLQGIWCTPPVADLGATAIAASLIYREFKRLRTGVGALSDGA